MNKTDQLYRGTAFQGQFRVFAVESTQTVQSARDLHDLSPINTFLMGKMISATAMMSLELKAPDSEISMRFEGDGELKGALIICNSKGDLRGYAYSPQLFLDEPQENFLPVKHLGSGTLSVIRSLPGRQPSTGFTSLVEGEVAQNIAHFYEQSEQIPTAVNLGVLIAKDASIKAAGGFMIQQLPQADAHYAEQIIANLARTPNISDLMDMGLTIKDILGRFVFTDGDFELQAVHAIRFRCNCSKARFERALKLLGKSELKEMLDGVDPQCHFCNAHYPFSGSEIAQLISELEEKP